MLGTCLRIPAKRERLTRYLDRGCNRSQKVQVYRER